jgi:hypothetical protein
VNERRVVSERELRVAQRLQRLVLDVDRHRGLGGDLGRQRRDGRDDVTLEANAITREEPPVLNQLAVEDVRDVLVCQHGEDAWHRTGSAGVDRNDASVRVVRVAELGVELTRQVQVGRIAARARDLLLAVRPDERLWFRSCFYGGHRARDYCLEEQRRHTKKPNPLKRLTSSR